MVAQSYNPAPEGQWQKKGQPGLQADYYSETLKKKISRDKKRRGRIKGGRKRRIKGRRGIRTRFTLSTSTHL